MDKKEVLKLSEGTYLDTPIKEYRKWPAISYSSLADFNESQDHALMEKPAKSYFEFGNAFELMVEDWAKGTKKFSEKFFTCDASGAMPEDLAGWIESGEDLNAKYKLKKGGERHGGSARLHEWLDECQANKGKMPMGKDQLESLSKMVENFMLMQPFADIGNANTMAEILPVADFQVPIVWHVGKPWDGNEYKPGYSMRKKALIDCLIQTNTTIYAFDIKTSADMKRFFWMMRDKYWLQETHYSEGLGHLFPGKDIVWRFLVSSKAAPFIAQPFCIDAPSGDYVGPSQYDKVLDEYSELCNRYQAWADEGYPPKGWKELERIKIYF